VAGHGHRLDPDIGHQPSRRGAGAAEDMSTEVQPVGVTRLAANAPAEPARALEHHHVAVAQVPGRCEAGDAAPDHDDVAHGLALAAGGVTGQAAEST
jgi:hypothetical protein